MNVELVTIESLRQALPGLDELTFTRRYPGAFVVTVGFLDARETLAAAGGEAPLVIEPAADSRCDDTSERRLDLTAGFELGRRARHDVAASHPLAGCAFFLRPVAGEEGHVLMGRGATCAITVPDRSVSERHCRIEVTPEAVVVIDLDSRNGTCVNQRRISPGQPVPLANEDILSLGRYSFQLVSAATLHGHLMEILSLDDP